MKISNLWKKIERWFSRKYCKRTDADSKNPVTDPAVEFYVIWKEKAVEVWKAAVDEDKVIWLLHPDEQKPGRVFRTIYSPRLFRDRLSDGAFINYFAYARCELVSRERALGLLDMKVLNAKRALKDAELEVAAFEDELNYESLPF